MWAPFFCVLSQGPKSGVLGGVQKVYVEKVYVLFRSPIDGQLPFIFPEEGEKSSV